MARPKISGHVLKVQRRRGAAWYVRMRLPDPQRPGKTKQSKRLLGPAWTERGRPPAGYYTAKLAEQELQAMLTDARRGVLAMSGAAPDGPTFGQAVDEWVRHIESEGGAPTYVKSCASAARRMLTPAFGADTPVASITPQDVEAVRDDLLRDKQRNTVHKVMIMCHGIFKTAKRKRWITANPCADVERVKVDKPSGVLNVLSVEEVHAVARVADDEQQGNLFIAAALTGLRMGELRALRWADVDFAQRAVHVRRNYTKGRLTTPKSGVVRSLPLADQVAVVLDRLSKREHYTEPGDLVFPNPYGRFSDDKEIRLAFYGAMKRAGLGHRREGPDPFVFHDLRHTFGTLCAGSGVPVGDIQHYMGHASLSTTEIYMHYAPKHDAADRLTAAFAPVAVEESLSAAQK